VKWLQTILGNVAADEIDKARAASATSPSNSRCTRPSPTRRPGSTPSSPTAAVAPGGGRAHELLLRIAAAVEQLPRPARRLHQQGPARPGLADTAAMGKTEKAVAGLLLRAAAGSANCCTTAREPAMTPDADARRP